MKVIFDWKARISAKGQKKLEGQIKVTLSSFFADWLNLEEVFLTVLSIGRGGKSQVGVQLVPAHKQFEMRKGVPVRIFTTGTQAATCTMSLGGLSDAWLRSVLSSDDVTEERSAPPPITEPAPSVGVEASQPSKEGSVESPSAESVVVSTPPELAKKEVKKETKTQAQELSAHEKLVANGMSEDDILRLKSTLSSIIYREYVEQGFKRLPNTLQVPVRHITEGILDHMELPHNAAGTYRGTIANFYAVRIALFALKWEDSIDPESRYTDWLFDCKRVIDFVGGKNNLIALAQERDKEVQARQENKKVLLSEAPTIEEIEKALSRDPISYEEVIYLLNLFRKVQACANRKLELARENEANQQQIVDDLRARLKEEERILAEATLQREKAESDRNDLELPPDVAGKIIAFRDEANALVADLGLE